MTLPQWEAQQFRLSAIGVTKAAALRELAPRLPLAPEWYNAHGDG